MQIRTQAQSILFLVAMTVFAAVSISWTCSANAQSPDPATEKPHPDLAIQYDYLRSNAPPSGCGCFNLNGGSATFAWPVKTGRFALAGDIGVSHAGSIANANIDANQELTLSTFTFGGRYTPRFHHSRFQPFAQVLAGFAHASGSLVEGNSPSASDAGAAFAGNFGGGVDLRGTRHFSFRLVEADYLITTFDNGGNNHQNNLRLSGGVVLHF
jgi:peptidoglycan-associated lipoprotein